jgi:hypothetical protein
MNEKLITAAEHMLERHRDLHAHSACKRGFCPTCETIRTYLREKAGEQLEKDAAPRDLVTAFQEEYA